jgi:hypothetical protein
VLFLIARKVVTPRTSETAIAMLTGMFPFTHRAEKSENAATDVPARMANVLVLLLVPMRGVYGARIWNTPEYSDLELTGFLANRIEPWGLFRVPVNLAVLNTDHTPYCVSSPNEELNGVLTKEWPHDILAALP